MSVFELNTEALPAQLRHAYQGPRELCHLEGDSQRLTVVGVKVQNELTFIRNAVAVAHYEPLTSSALVRVADLVSWGIVSGYYVATRSTVQDEFDLNVLPVVD